MTCPHGMPSPASCLDCMDEGLLPPAKPEPSEAFESRAFRAKYDGQCPGCNLSIYKGAMVVLAGEEDGVRRAYHVGCVR